jgi:hypothetical protein
MTGSIVELERLIRQLRVDDGASRMAPLRRPVEDLLRIADPPAELPVSKQRLAPMSRGDEFPELLEVSRKHVLVRRNGRRAAPERQALGRP